MPDDETTLPEGWIAPTVEPEEEEPEPDEEEEPEPEPEPEPPTDEAMEKLYKSVENKTSAYRRGQQKLLAETGVPWQDCPCCAVPGFVLPFNPEDEDDQMRRLVVLDYFQANEPELRAASDRQACEACDGWGQVLSGSKNPTHRVVPCSRCNGTGYVAALSGVFTSEANGAYGPETQPASIVGSEQLAAPDYWGRPPGHRDYGTLPSLVNA